MDPIRTGSKALGARHVQRRPGRGLAPAHQFGQRRPGAQGVDQVRLPVGRAVAQVGRIQGRFLVREVRILLEQLAQLFGRGEGGDRLRQELVLQARLQQRDDLAGRIAACRHCRLHQHARTLQGFFAGVLLQQIIGHHAGRAEADREDGKEDHIEFRRNREFHGPTSVLGNLFYSNYLW